MISEPTPDGKREAKARAATRRLQSGGVAFVMARAKALASAIETTPQSTPKCRRPAQKQYPVLHPRKGKLLTIVRLLLDGISHREIARRCGAHSTTIARARDFLETFVGESILCPCGKPSNHQGWCSVRFKQSVKRPEFIRSWSERQRASRAGSPR